MSVVLPVPFGADERDVLAALEPDLGAVEQDVGLADLDPAVLSSKTTRPVRSGA